MVFERKETGLEEFAVDGNVLSRSGNEIARFATPICELARLDDRLFVILHPYPIDKHPDYAGTNLWALDTDGNLIWKAENLAIGRWPDVQSRFYKGMYIFDINNPKIVVGTGEDRYVPIIDINTGLHIFLDYQSAEASRVPSQIFTKARKYLLADATEAPSFC